MVIRTLGGEPVTIDEYLRRLRDGTEPEPTPERTAEAWARRHAPPDATEEEIARMAEARLPRQILLADLGDAIADEIIATRSQPFSKDRPGRRATPCPSPRPETGSAPAGSASMRATA